MAPKQLTDWLKELLTKYGRPLMVKWATRGVLWIATFISAKVAIDNPDAGTVGNIAEWVAAAACAALSLLIDRWHDKTDKAEVPTTG